MTLEGTNSYLIRAGENSVIAVDPGPAIDEHIDALAYAASAQHARIAGILVTHGHPDHAPGAQHLAVRTGAPVYAHANATFPHDRSLADEEELRFEETTIVAYDAPGHTFDHLVFLLREERALFTGDVILGRGTVVIAPPGGAMRPYLATLSRLRDALPALERIYPGHGPVVDEPAAKIAQYVEHRMQREREILARLEWGAATVPELVRDIYAALDRRMWPAAGRQIVAYLIALENEGRVRSTPLDRGPTADETAILNPDLRSIVDPHEAAVARAELGFDRAAPLQSYALLP